MISADAARAQERERNLHVMTRNLNYDVSLGEYLCAICDRLSNTVLPVVPSLACLRRRQGASAQPPLEIGMAEDIYIVSPPPHQSSI